MSSARVSERARGAETQRLQKYLRQVPSQVTRTCTSRWHGQAHVEWMHDANKHTYACICICACYVCTRCKLSRARSVLTERAKSFFGASNRSCSKRYRSVLSRKPSRTPIPRVQPYAEPRAEPCAEPHAEPRAAVMPRAMASRMASRYICLLVH